MQEKVFALLPGCLAPQREFAYFVVLSDQRARRIQAIPLFDKTPDSSSLRSSE